MNHELPDEWAVFQRGRQTSHIWYIMEKAKEFQRNIYFCFKAFDCVDHNKLWILKGRSARPPYLSPEKSVCGSRSNRTGHGTTEWFKIGKGVHEGCILSPCLFNWYAKCIIQNAGLNESQSGIKTTGRNINNFRHTDDTTIMAESKEELKSLLMSMKEES